MWDAGCVLLQAGCLLIVLLLLAVLLPVGCTATGWLYCRGVLLPAGIPAVLLQTRLLPDAASLRGLFLLVCPPQVAPACTFNRAYAFDNVHIDALRMGVVGCADYATFLVWFLLFCCYCYTLSY